MEAKEVILRSLEQSDRVLTRALDGLTQQEAAWSPNEECNSILFILWHLVRVEDINVNRVIQHEDELYNVEGWQEKLGTPANESGGRYTLEKLKTWPIPKMEVLQGYASSVRRKTSNFLESISEEKLSENVSRPDGSLESIGNVLGRMSTEIAMHVGQIAYLRGVQRGLDK